MDLIDEYLQHLADLDRSEETIGSYRGILRRMDEQIPAGLENATADEIKAWVNAPKPDGSPRCAKSRSLYRSVAVKFFDWACGPNVQVLDFNSARLTPEVSVPRGTRVRPIDTDTLRLILGSAVMPYRRWFLIASHAGLRCIELARLERSDINRQEMRVFGKGSVTRYVPTHPLIWAEVQGVKGPVCPRLDGGRARPEYISSRGNDYLQNMLGMPDVHMHRLRKYFATATYKTSGKDLRAVQKLLGHANIGTTELYVEPESGGMVAAVADLPSVI